MDVQCRLRLQNSCENKWMLSQLITLWIFKLCYFCTRIFMPMSTVRVCSHVSASAGPIGIAAKVQDMSFMLLGTHLTVSSIILNY